MTIDAGIDAAVVVRHSSVAVPPELAAIKLDMLPNWDRDAAEALTNIELYADRALMPAETEDEFYVADLIGLSAVTVAGERLGEVVDVVNYGAGDIVEVKPPHGGDTLLFPFTKAVVPEIDIPGRRVVIAPPAEVDGEPPAA